MRRNSLKSISMEHVCGQPENATSGSFQREPDEFVRSGKPNEYASQPETKLPKAEKFGISFTQGEWILEIDASKNWLAARLKPELRSTTQVRMSRAQVEALYEKLGRELGKPQDFSIIGLLKSKLGILPCPIEQQFDQAFEVPDRDAKPRGWELPEFIRPGEKNAPENTDHIDNLPLSAHPDKEFSLPESIWMAEEKPVETQSLMDCRASLNPEISCNPGESPITEAEKGLPQDMELTAEAPADSIPPEPREKSPEELLELLDPDDPNTTLLRANKSSLNLLNHLINHYFTTTEPF